MKKQRKINMKIHHKNMKQVSLDMQQWVQSNLAHLGIFECGYANYNFVEQSFLPIPMHHEWYCQYMEQDLDLLTATRVAQASKYWDMQNTIHKKYNDFIEQRMKKNFYKIDFIQKNADSYELLTVGTERPFSPQEYLEIQKHFRHISYQADQIRKQKSHVLSELRPWRELKNLHQEKSVIDTASEYEKAKFDDITLTAKEQLYIEYLMMNKTHKEIAFNHEVSDVAVRNVLRNIKRKLGNDYMSTSLMFKRLKSKGVLSVCSQSFSR